MSRNTEAVCFFLFILVAIWSTKLTSIWVLECLWQKVDCSGLILQEREIWRFARMILSMILESDKSRAIDL